MGFIVVSSSANNVCWGLLLVNSFCFEIFFRFMSISSN